MKSCQFYVTVILIQFIGTLQSAEKKIDFAHDVLPILKSRCSECHTGDKHKGGLSMNDRATLLKAEVVVPGQSAKSELLKRITTTDAEERMPPKGNALTKREIDILKRWIDEGLAWEEGFTFNKVKYQAPLKLTQPKIPPTKAGFTHPIDRFVADYQAKLKVKPTPMLDDALFLRRLYLDVIGLLPTPKQLDDFLKDKSADKRDKAIKTVLNHRRAYAEHWLTFWNDLLRNDYRGTGYIDGGRKQITSWLYPALIENKPYDQFVRELIDPTALAEGFIKGIKWRGRVNASQVQELQFARNVGQVFLGINLKCASCHDSFIDNLKLKDAYGMAAIVSEHPLKIHKCDKPINELAEASFLYPELGNIDPKQPRKQRLKKLAELLTSKDNGWFTRTIVNRLWDRLFGRGIVHPVDVMSNRPWSQDLLDYLAGYLIEVDYDVKKLLEHIVTSKTYQSQVVSLAQPVEGDKYVFQGPLAKRMTAEQFLDAIWRITNTAPRTAHARVGNRGKEPVRASLVVADALMRSLGRPNREQVVTTRPAELSTLQALDLSNGEILANLLDRGAKNIQRQHPDWNREQLVEWLYRSAFSRSPTKVENEVASKVLSEKVTVRELSDYLWMVFMLPEFQLIR